MLALLLYTYINEEPTKTFGVLGSLEGVDINTENSEEERYSVVVSISGTRRSMQGTALSVQGERRNGFEASVEKSHVPTACTSRSPWARGV